VLQSLIIMTKKEVFSLSNRRATPYIASLLILISFLDWALPRCHAQQTKKPFTVVDDIGLTLFWPVGFRPKMVQLSPDNNYFAVYTERGRVDLNRVDDSLRFYRSQDVDDFLEHSVESLPPSPIWIVNRSAKEGPVIKNGAGCPTPAAWHFWSGQLAVNIWFLPTSGRRELKH